MTILSRSRGNFSIVFLFLCGPAMAQDLMRDISTRSEEFQAVLGFEGSTNNEPPFPWSASSFDLPNVSLLGERIVLDRETFHSGQASARIHHGDTPNFSGLELQVPIDFSGSSIEIRAMMRTGQSEWAQLSTSVSLDSSAHTLQVVIPLAGPGDLWIDDVEMLIDGRPISEVDQVDRVLTDQERNELIEKAEKAAPPSISSAATIRTVYGLEKLTLREGANGWTCWAETAGHGVMCNEPEWDELFEAYWNRDDTFSADRLSVSYMLAGDGEPPHVMILVPNEQTLDGLSTSQRNPIWSMWKESPFHHIMLFTSDAQSSSTKGIQRVILVDSREESGVD